jgi:hypothetical protein
VVLAGVAISEEPASRTVIPITRAIDDANTIEYTHHYRGSRTARAR